MRLCILHDSPAGCRLRLVVLIRRSTFVAHHSGPPNSNGCAIKPAGAAVSRFDSFLL